MKRLRQKNTERDRKGVKSLWTLLLFLSCCTTAVLLQKADHQVIRASLKYNDLEYDAPVRTTATSPNKGKTHKAKGGMLGQIDSISGISTNNDDNNDKKSANTNTIEEKTLSDSFSACIMWADDNFRLEEWLAYHYYLLKLRYVVIAIDDWNKTSVDAIVDRWNDAENKYNLNMTIKVWRDREYIYSYKHRIAKIKKSRNLENATTDVKLQKYATARTNYHRSKQPQFYKACSKHLIQQNKSWTSFHDTDEFITFDHELNGVDITAKSSKKMEQPGYILDRLNEIKTRFPPDKYGNETGLSCLVVPRRRFCAKELSTDEINNLFSPSADISKDGIIPEGIANGSINSATTTNTATDNREAVLRRFDTLRFKYLTAGKDGNPKSFIDLSQGNPQLYVQDQWDDNKRGVQHPWNAHKAMPWLCYKESWNRFSEIQKLVTEENFIFGHYLGSFESYSFRDDSRKGGLRTYDIWKERSSRTAGEYSHVIRPWLRGFVELVGGPDVASYLLQDAGKFPEDYDVNVKMDEYRTTYDYNAGNRRRRRNGG